MEYKYVSRGNTNARKVVTLIVTTDIGKLTRATSRLNFFSELF